jgi:predicted  nucleic acid-binding Zn-ribbon protein
MALKCLACTVTFSPMMRVMLQGTNKAGKDVYIYYQNCPECNELLIGVKKADRYNRMPLPSETEGLVFLKE